ncbi:MAG: nucleotidyltransferase [Flavobacteriales bacterium]|jgi:hypothetical protein|nr:nucleotidyltransferase [Flavobacteriales bacterium]
MINNYSNFLNAQELNERLKQLTEVLDLTTTQYKDAVAKYEAIAKYLKNDDTIALLEPDMYPQGSFSLGTVIKPLSDKEEYDIDLVCELKKGNALLHSQYYYKELIGDRLKSGIYKDKLKDKNGGKRCWTIEYAEATQLHLDILPAIPDSYSRLIFESVNNYGDTAISITDKEHHGFYRVNDDWVKSNPRGYQKWFKDQMLLMLNESKKLFAKSMNANIDDVPDYEVKTPLQRAVQLLKRHRDTTCDDNDDKPISIIITTLSAKAYGNEDNLLDALINILNGMENHIKYENKQGKTIAVIENPVDSRENFADKWEKFPIRQKVFFEWLRNAKKYFKELVSANDDIQWINEHLSKGFGKDIVSRSLVSIGNNTREKREGGKLKMALGSGIINSTVSAENTKEIKNHNFYGNERQ